MDDEREKRETAFGQPTPYGAPDEDKLLVYGDRFVYGFRVTRFELPTWCGRMRTKSSPPTSTASGEEPKDEQSYGRGDALTRSPILSARMTFRTQSFGPTWLFGAAIVEALRSEGLFTKSWELSRRSWSWSRLRSSTRRSAAHEFEPKERRSESHDYLAERLEREAAGGNDP